MAISLLYASNLKGYLGISYVGARAAEVAISYRPIRSKDVRECVGIVARHPVLQRRYGDTVTELKAVWLGLMGRESFRTVVFEDSRDPSTKIIGAGVSAFVSDDFLRSLKRPPFSWVGPN